jgi:hypothetical protein
MELRYEVSPSEAGIVVDGLLARGLQATLLPQNLGDDAHVVSIQGVDQDRTAEVGELLRDLASTATPVPTE